MAAEPADVAPGPSSATPPVGTWPHALSHDPSLRVGDVLAALVGEFPSLSPSKLRFLDKQGLVSPERTPAGYRQYSHADVERLRFVLRTQRDAYAPLQVIAERLADLDAGRAYEPVALSTQDNGVIGAEQLAEAAGADVATLGALADAGVIAAVAPGQYEASSVPLARAAVEYVEAGADMREVRGLVRVMQREHEAARAAAAPLRRTDDDAAAIAAHARRMDAAAALVSALAAQPPSHGRATPP